MSSNLAILGGDPTIKKPHIIDRNSFDSYDVVAIEQFLDGDNVLSFYGDEGIQQAYEHSLANYLGKKYCVLTNSGTNALLAAYFSLSLMPGDEIIVPAHSFFAISTSALQLGLNVIICDCEKDTGLIDLTALAKLITNNTKAVVVNHLCGDCVDMEALTILLHSRNIILIEDLSLAFGGEYNKKKLGSFGDLTCFSLGSTKLLSGGQGGAVVTDNQTLYERIILLGCFGQRAKQNVMNPFYRKFSDASFGMNMRMHSLAIAVSYARFNRLNELINKRHVCYNELSKRLGKFDFIQTPRQTPQRFRGAWHGYYALYKQENMGVSLDRIVEALRAEGLYVSRGCHYVLLNRAKIHQTIYDGLHGLRANPSPKATYSDADCPNAAYYNEQTISFPLFLHENELVELYCSACEKVFSNIAALRSK